MKYLLPFIYTIVFIAGSSQASAQSRPAPLAYADGKFENIKSNLGEVYKLGTGRDTLLLIPCASCRWRSFDEFMVRNQDRYTMYAVTLPGYGGTEPPDLPKWTGEPLWQNHAVTALELLMEQQKMSGVTVIGSSFGSTVALKLAGHRPKQVIRLVNLDGSFVSSLETEKRSKDERMEFARKTMLQWGFPYTTPDRWQKWNSAAIAARPDRRMLYHGWFMATDPKDMMQYWRENLLESRNNDFRNLSIPVLDVQAIRPWDETPEETRSTTEESIAEVGTPENYQLIFLYDTPHFIMEERPELLDQIIEDFIAGKKLSDFNPDER